MNNLIYKPTHFNNLLYKSYQHVKCLDDFAGDKHDGSKERTEVTVYIYGTILRNEIADDIQGAMSGMMVSNKYQIEIKIIAL